MKTDPVRGKVAAGAREDGVGGEGDSLLLGTAPSMEVEAAMAMDTGGRRGGRLLVAPCNGAAATYGGAPVAGGEGGDGPVGRCGWI